MQKRMDVILVYGLQLCNICNILIDFYPIGCPYSGAKYVSDLNTCLYFNEWTSLTSTWDLARTACGNLASGGDLAVFDLSNTNLETILLNCYPILASKFRIILILYGDVTYILLIPIGAPASLGNTNDIFIGGKAGATTYEWIDGKKSFLVSK